MSLDMDKMVAKIVGLTVGFSKYSRYAIWQPGDKLRILLIGYNGKRNTGADVRVAAIVDQIYHIMGQENIEIGVLTLCSRELFSAPTPARSRRLARLSSPSTP